MRTLALFAERSALIYAETVLFIGYYEREFFKLDILLNEGVRAHGKL
jgi:hypothetical protein